MCYLYYRGKNIFKCLESHFLDICYVGYFVKTPNERKPHRKETEIAYSKLCALYNNKT